MTQYRPHTPAPRHTSSYFLLTLPIVIVSVRAAQAHYRLFHLIKITVEDVSQCIVVLCAGGKAVVLRTFSGKFHYYIFEIIINNFK